MVVLSWSGKYSHTTPISSQLNVFANDAFQMAIVNVIFTVSMCHFQETTSLRRFVTRLDTVYCLMPTNGYDIHNNKIQSHPSAIIFSVLVLTRGAVHVCNIAIWFHLLTYLMLKFDFVHAKSSSNLKALDELIRCHKTVDCCFCKQQTHYINTHTHSNFSIQCTNKCISVSIHAKSQQKSHNRNLIIPQKRSNSSY